MEINGSELTLPSSAWILYSGNVHVTNDKSLLMNPKQLDGLLTDNFDGKAKVEKIGNIHLKLLNNLIIDLEDVHYVPEAKYNLVSQGLISKDFDLHLSSKGSDILLKQPNNKISEISFTKLIGQNNVLLTKEQSIIKFAFDQPSKLENYELSMTLNEAKVLLDEYMPNDLKQLSKKFLELKINTSDELEKIVDLIFERSITESDYFEEYASLCRNMRSIKVQDASGVYVTFIFFLIGKVQNFFEFDLYSEIEKLLEEIKKNEDAKKKKILIDKLDEEKRLAKKKSLGNIKLIGAFYNKKMLNDDIINLCFQNLMKRRNEVSLEYLCCLLKSVGENMEKSLKYKNQFNKVMDYLEVKIYDFGFRNESLIMDVLNMRRNGWKLLKNQKSDYQTTATTNGQNLNNVSKIELITNNVQMTKEPSVELPDQNSESLNLFKDDQQVKQKNFNSQLSNKKINDKLKKTTTPLSMNQTKPIKFEFLSINKDRKQKMNSSKPKSNDNSPDKLVQKVDQLLTELIPKNVYKLIGHLLKLEINTAEMLERIVDLIFNKAINESVYCEQYALVCLNLFEISVFNNDGSNLQEIKFHELLSDRCDKVFNEIGNYDCEINIKNYAKEIEQCTDEHERQILINSVFKDKILIKKRWLGNIKLIGLLYRINNYLQDEAIDFCIDQLINKKDENSLECLCTLLQIIGSKYVKNAKERKTFKLDHQMKILEDLIKQNDISVRIKSLVVSVLDCHKNGWQSLKSENIIDDKSKGFKFTNEINQLNSEPVAQPVLKKTWVYSGLWEKEQSTNADSPNSGLSQQINGDSANITDEEFLNSIEKCILDSTHFKSQGFYSLKQKIFSSKLIKLPIHKLKDNLDLQLMLIYKIVKTNWDLGNRKDYLTELFIFLFANDFIEKKTFLTWYNDHNQLNAGNLVALDLMKKFIHRLEKNKIINQKI